MVEGRVHFVDHYEFPQLFPADGLVAGVGIGFGVQMGQKNMAAI